MCVCVCGCTCALACMLVFVCTLLVCAFVQKQELVGTIKVLARTYNLYERCIYNILAGKSPNSWSFTVCIHGSGQP